MGRPRKIINDSSVENVEEVTIEKKDTTNSVPVNNESTNKELDEMKMMMQTLMEQIGALKAENEELKNSKSEVKNDVSDDDSYEDDYIEISPNKPIRVISLFKGGLTLKTNQDGSGKNFRFDKYGHTRTIAYSDLQDCIAVTRNLIEEGYVYICDKDVVRNNYLEDYYKRFIKKEHIDGILNFSDEDIRGMIENTTRPIQETIILNIVEKINKNEYVNRDKADLIGKCCTPTCDIFALALQERVGQ